MTPPSRCLRCFPFQRLSDHGFVRDKIAAPVTQSPAHAPKNSKQCLSVRERQRHLHMHHVAPRRLRVHSAPLKSALSFFLIINLVGPAHSPSERAWASACFKPRTRRWIRLSKTKIALAAQAV